MSSHVSKPGGGGPSSCGSILPRLAVGLLDGSSTAGVTLSDGVIVPLVRAEIVLLRALSHGCICSPVGPGARGYGLLTYVTDPWLDSQPFEQFVARGQRLLSKLLRFLAENERLFVVGASTMIMSLSHTALRPVLPLFAKVRSHVYPTLCV